MLRKMLSYFVLPLLLLLSNSSENSVAGSKQTSPQGQTGTLQKVIVADGSITMDLDLNQLNGINSVAGRSATLRFTAPASSFFPILVFNDLLRGPEPGLIELVP